MPYPLRIARDLHTGRHPASRTRSGFAAGLALMAAGLAAVTPVFAQDAPARLLTLGLSTGLVANTNRRLDPDDPESSSAATTGLSFAYRDATPLQLLSISGDLGLRYSQGTEDEEDDNGLTDPAIGFAYQRTVPDTSFSVSGSLRRSEVDFLQPLDAFLLDPDDPLFNPEDLTRTSEQGTQLSYNLQAATELRRRAPFGIDLSAGVSGTRYSGTDDPSLEDSDRARLGVGLRFRLDPVTQARLGVRYLTQDSDDPEEVQRNATITAGIARDYPLGQVGLQASVTDTDDGQRTQLSVSAARSSTTWDLSGSLGVADGSGGELTAVGGLRAQREFAASQIGVAFDRSVRTGDTSEVTLTALSVDYGFRLTPRLSVTTNAAWVRTVEASGPAEDAIRLGLTGNRPLTEDWALSAGVTHRIEDNDDGRAQDTALSIGLRREFAFIP
jgi:hypothetical protein